VRHHRTHEPAGPRAERIWPTAGQSVPFRGPFVRPRRHLV